MGLSVLHYALYKGNLFLLENIIQFAIKNQIYIEPSYDVNIYNLYFSFITNIKKVFEYLKN